jgi:hypothetical protein
VADGSRTGAPSGLFAGKGRANRRDIQRGNGQAMTLSGVPDRIDHEFTAEVGANGLPGWFGGFVDKEQRRTVQEIEEMRR